MKCSAELLGCVGRKGEGGAEMSGGGVVPCRVRALQCLAISCISFLHHKWCAIFLRCRLSTTTVH